MTDDYPEPLQQRDRVYVVSRGRKLTYFGGCDYFRLSSNPRVLRAVRSGLARFGLSTAASRKTTGNHAVYGQLEAAAAEFFGAESVILTSSGYLANVAAAQALRGRVERVYVDERSHRSLWEALRLVDAPVETFGHRSALDLKKKIGRKGRRGLVAVTDGVFAHDGSVAPLRDYRRVLGRQAILWTDDAHGVGVLGRNGGGAVEEAGLRRERLIQTMTFSKAFGSYGGAILCEREFGAHLIRESGVISGNTPIPLPLACGSLVALGLAGNAALRGRLERNLQLFWKESGLRARSPLTPIISFTSPDPGKVERALLKAGIHPPLIRYPGGFGG